jgi:hypothetical protein
MTKILPVVEACKTIITGNVGLHCHTIPHRDPTHVRPHRCDHTGELVTGYDGVRTHILSVENVDVGPADTAGLHLHPDLTALGLGKLDLLHFNMVGLDDRQGSHDPSFLASSTANKSGP